jgi:hypothetical protein
MASTPRARSNQGRRVELGVTPPASRLSRSPRYGMLLIWQLRLP